MGDRQVEGDERQVTRNDRQEEGQAAVDDRQADGRRLSRRLLVATGTGHLALGLTGCTDLEEDDGAQ